MIGDMVRREGANRHRVICYRRRTCLGVRELKHRLVSNQIVLLPKQARRSSVLALISSDLPVQCGQTGEFAWKGAAFLRALQDGGWVLLDEMNLAPQAALEGLNAVLDH